MIASVKISVTLAYSAHIFSTAIACLAHRQVGFPGGRMQRSDGGSEMCTAQREVEEELGLVIGERQSQNQSENQNSHHQVRVFHSARRRVASHLHPDRREQQKHCEFATALTSDIRIYSSAMSNQSNSAQPRAETARVISATAAVSVPVFTRRLLCRTAHAARFSARNLHPRFVWFSFLALFPMLFESFDWKYP
jgi:hypothetical protein